MPNSSDSVQHDLFLSYNSADYRIVEEVADRLADEGLKKLFLDRRNLPIGIPWRPTLEKALRCSKAVAVFVGPGEMGSWQQREVDIALDLQRKSANFPVIPVLLPGCEPPLGFLGQLTWVDFRSKALDVGIAILARAARGVEPDPELQRHLDDVRASICPYRGLLYFREEDAPFFFGREVPIERLMGEVQRQSFVAVVGASGSGKSSVVRAGLVPRLRRDRDTAWETVILVPTDQPLKALARAFLPLLEAAMGEVDRLAEATKLAEHFRSGTISLYDIVGRILEKQSGTDRILIVVDQFEELYTLTSDDEDRRRFVDVLLAASSRGGSKANITLTLRGDFVGKALAYRPLSDRLQDAQINLGPMTLEELECAIRKPAEKIQLEFEAGLVKRILNDVGDEPGNLPLLEFVLKELWDKRRGRILLNETYDAIGGLQGAVATKADELFKGLSSAEQKILQRIFLRIVRPSAESGPDTRRRAAFAELPREAIDLITKLANERLLVTNQSESGQGQTVEVAHEALISNWSTLRAWVNEDREFLLWRDRLGPLVAGWERAQESVDAVLRGPLLTEAQKWFDQRSQDLSEQERKFISASREERERIAREEKERQERELEAARKLAGAQKERAEQAEKAQRLEEERARLEKDQAERRAEQEKRAKDAAEALAEVEGELRREQEARAAEEVRRQHMRIREAMGRRVYDDFAAALREIVLHRDEIQKSFLASINLVGVLTHAVERRDPRSGRGWLKRQQVKAAVRYLFKADKFDLPNVPDYLRRYVIDIVVDWSIDFVVVISNQHALWEEPGEEQGEEPVRASIRAALGETLCWLAKVTQPIWGRIVQFFGFLWEALQQRTVLTPELQKALDDAVRAGLVKEMRAGVERAQGLVVWLGEHRDRVQAFFQLISEAVQITETLFSSSKSGPEKKAYARDLTMSTLRELGSPLGSGLFSLIAEGLIDTAVKLFNFPETKPAFNHGFRGNEPSAPTDAEIERLVRFLSEAMGGVYDDFDAALREIVQHRDEIQKSFLASINLVGNLTHAAERHNPGPGRGWLKKEQVKAAIRYLFKADKFDVPYIPDYLRPYLIDIVADWTIEFVVVISNQHALWEEPGEEPVRTSIRAAIEETLCRLAKVTRPIWRRPIEFFAFLWEALQEWTVFTPELQKALDKAEGLVKEMREWVGRAPQLVVWVAKHRAQVMAYFHLVSEAVQTTETLFSTSKSGPGKKAYARALIMSTLEELSSPLGSGLFSLIAQGLIGNLIAAVVELFNNFPMTNPAFKHGSLAGRSRQLELRMDGG